MKDQHAEVVGREQAPGVVHPRQRVALELREIGFVVVAALLEHDHVFSRGGEHAGDDSTARAGADDDYVAVERRVA